MLFSQVLCIIMILLCLFIAIKPLKIINTIRVIFNQAELQNDDFKVLIYRLLGIGGVIVFGLFLVQTF